MSPRMQMRAVFAIVVVAVISVAIAWSLKPSVKPSPDREIAPLVEVVEAQPRDLRFVVNAQGTVVPRSESELIPQVSGEVIWVSPNLVAGGFFDAGEPLIRLDPSDQRVDLEAARAVVARSRSEFARAETEIERQRRLADQGVASQARIDDAEKAFRVAEAELREELAKLARAERNLERTEILAPYQGRVRSESVDVGQFASRGNALARLYATDYAEVRLPLPDRDLFYLDIPFDLSGGAVAREAEFDATSPGGLEEGSEETSSAGIEVGSELTDSSGPEEKSKAAGPGGPEVLLRAEFAGEPRNWIGHIVRTEGEIDAKSRMVHLVARVEDPYGQNAAIGSAPLAVGLFVEAEIQGRKVEDVFVLPRRALRTDIGEDLVYVVDVANRLRFTPVEVLRAKRDEVVIGSGLQAGDRVCVSPMAAAVDGMAVRTLRAGEGEGRLGQQEQGSKNPDSLDSAMVQRPQ